MTDTTVYTVHEDGSVFSSYKNDWLKPSLAGRYLVVRLGQKWRFSVSRLVAQVFIPNPDNKPAVNHLDGNKFNNHYTNLEWCTYSENMKHAYDTGLRTQANGNENSSTRIPEEELSNIQEMYKNGSTQKYIADIYGVTQSQISRIVNKNRRVTQWKLT
jgi:predicted XRE-type DNA-binding protein